jgi:hypothetical protein
MNGNGTKRATSAGVFDVMEAAIPLASSMASCLVCGFTASKKEKDREKVQKVYKHTVSATAWQSGFTNDDEPYLLLTLPVTSAIVDKQNRQGKK